MKDILVAICLLTGAGFSVTSAIGLLKLPDLLCRSHAVAKASSLGIFLMLIGMWIHLGDEVSGLKLMLAMFFQVFTIPVSSHMVGMLSYEKKLPRWSNPVAPDAGAEKPET